MAKTKEIVVNGQLTRVTEFDHTAQQIDDATQKFLDGYTAKDVGAAAKPEFILTTMVSSGWVGNTYSFEDTYPADSYDLSIEVAETATAEQFEAFGGAMICGSADRNIATAIGDVPPVDVPIIVKVVEK